MKKFRALAALIALALLISGCAGLSSAERYNDEVRGDYVAAVERAAQRNGVEVIWLNPPMQRRSRDIEWTTRREVELNRQSDP